jgi:hypothetical protein
MDELYGLGVARADQITDVMYTGIAGGEIRRTGTHERGAELPRRAISSNRMSWSGRLSRICGESSYRRPAQYVTSSLRRSQLPTLSDELRQQVGVGLVKNVAQGMDPGAPLAHVQGACPSSNADQGGRNEAASPCKRSFGPIGLDL